jgi:alkaline phosphatase
MQSGECTLELSLMTNGALQTYNTDAQVPDSAGTATAIFCGEKARDGVIGVNQNVVLGNCSTLAGNEIPSIIHHSIEAGKWTGVVSTARITHATPAAAYAHSPHRDWESIGDIDEADRVKCTDIAYQLIHNNTRIRVGQVVLDCT